MIQDTGYMKFNIIVTPRSSKNELTLLSDGTRKVRLTAPPVDGAANEALIEFLSETFGVRKPQIQIVKGERGRKKVIQIL